MNLAASSDAGDKMNDQGLRLLALLEEAGYATLHRPLPENDVASLNQSGIQG
mgnify:CR=1 FL=1